MLQSNTYDASGRLLQRVDGVGSGVKYEYDFTGAQRRMESMGGASQEFGNMVPMICLIILFETRRQKTL